MKKNILDSAEQFILKVNKNQIKTKDYCKLLMIILT